MARVFQVIIAMIVVLGTSSVSEAGDVIEWKLRLSGYCSKYIQENLDNIKAYKAATLTLKEATDYALRPHPESHQNYSTLDKIIINTVITSIYRNLNIESIHKTCVKAGLKYDRDGDKTVADENNRLSRESPQGEVEPGGRTDSDKADEYESAIKSQSNIENKDNTSGDEADSPAKTQQPGEETGVGGM